MTASVLRLTRSRPVPRGRESDFTAATPRAAGRQHRIPTFDSERPKFEENTVARSHTITGWDPENRTAWEAGGQSIARRNLVWSVAAEHVGFSVWSLWSVMVLRGRGAGHPAFLGKAAERPRRSARHRRRAPDGPEPSSTARRRAACRRWCFPWCTVGLGWRDDPRGRLPSSPRRRPRAIPYRSPRRSNRTLWRPSPCAFPSAVDRPHGGAALFRRS